MRQSSIEDGYASKGLLGVTSAHFLSRENGLRSRDAELKGSEFMLDLLSRFASSFNHNSGFKLIGIRPHPRSPEIECGSRQDLSSHSSESCNYTQQCLSPWLTTSRGLRSLSSIFSTITASTDLETPFSILPCNA